MIKRNHAYIVGDTEYSMEGYKLVCKTAGTTAPTPISMGGGGQTIIDGTVEWEVTLGEDAMPSDITESIVYTPSTIDEWLTLEFVAPANGFVGIFISPKGDGNSIVKLQQGIDGDFDQGLSVTSTSQKSSSRVIGCYMPVSKGKSIRLSSLLMNASGLCICQFVYSVGEAKRLGLI